MLILRWVAATAITLVVATGMATDSSAQLQMTYANGSVRTHAQVGVVADEWIKRIEAETDGRVKVRHVFGGSLLKFENMLEGLRGRTADFGSAVVSFFPGQLPISATLAGTVDLDLGNRLDIKGVTAITMKLIEEFPEFSGEFEKLGLKPLFWVVTPPYGFITKEPVESYKGLARKKIRTIGSIIPQLLNAAGGVPVAVAVGEVYTSMQTGVLDGALSDPAGMVAFKFPDLAKNLLLTGPKLGAMTLAAPVAYLANSESWNKIGDADRKTIDRINREIAAYGADLMASDAASALTKMRDMGVKITNISLAEATEWRKAAPDFLKNAADSINKSGGPGDRLMARYQVLADEYVSGKWRP